MIPSAAASIGGNDIVISVFISTYFSSFSIIVLVIEQGHLPGLLKQEMIIDLCLFHEIIVPDQEFLKHITRLYALAHIVQTLLHKGVESIVIRQFPDIWIVVVGDEELAGAMELLMHFIHKPKQFSVFIAAEARLLIVILCTLVRRVQQNERIFTGTVGNTILVVTMHDCRIPKSGACCNQSAESFGHILFCNSEVLPGGRETEHLILIESNSEIKVIPLDVLDDYRGFCQIVQNIWDLSKQCFIGSEDLL